MMPGVSREGAAFDTDAVTDRAGDARVSLGGSATPRGPYRRFAILAGAGGGAATSALLDRAGASIPNAAGAPASALGAMTIGAIIVATELAMGTAASRSGAPLRNTAIP